MLQFTCHLSDKVKVAVDAYFNLEVEKIVHSFTETDLVVIRKIDHATRVLDNGIPTDTFKTPLGTISATSFSSGTKSVLLVLYRMRNPHFGWIPSLDSMGLNAKGVLFNILQSCTLDFPMYCTTYGLPNELGDFQCIDDQGQCGTFSEVILRMRKAEGLE